MILYYFLTFLMAFLFSAVSVPFLRKLAFYLDIVDIPTSPIKSHTKVMPYLGGVAVFLGFIVSLALTRLVTEFPTGTLHNLRGIFLGGTLIFLLGLWDDIRDHDFRLKLAVEAVAAVILIIYEVKLGFQLPEVFIIFFSLLWIVGITNSFNLIDVMDGLSSSVAVVASLAFFFISLPEETFYVNFAALAIMGSSLGFLIYNFPPAKIFMGDAGSLFIGFVMASISLGGKYTGTHTLGIFVPLIILSIPIFDTLVISYFRWEKKRSIFLGSRDHFALRMLSMGFSVREILFRVAAAMMLLSLTAYFITRVSYAYAILLYGVLVLIGF